MRLLQAVMASVVYEVAACLLLLVAVRGTSVQPKQIIYVDKVNGTLNSWKNKAESLDHVELYKYSPLVSGVSVTSSRNQQLLYLMIHYVPPGSSLIPPQTAHADVEMMFTVLLGVMTLQKSHQYSTATA